MIKSFLNCGGTKDRLCSNNPPLQKKISFIIMFLWVCAELFLLPCLESITPSRVSGKDFIGFSLETQVVSVCGCVFFRKLWGPVGLLSPPLAGPAKRPPITVAFVLVRFAGPRKKSSAISGLFGLTTDRRAVSTRVWSPHRAKPHCLSPF